MQRRNDTGGSKFRPKLGGMAGSVAADFRPILIVPRLAGLLEA